MIVVYEYHQTSHQDQIFSGILDGASMIAQPRTDAPAIRDLVLNLDKFDPALL